MMGGEEIDGATGTAGGAISGCLTSTVSATRAGSGEGIVWIIGAATDGGSVG